MSQENDERKEYVVINAMTIGDNKSLRLLVLKNRPAWQAGYLNLIGGKVEPTDATVQDAALRELREETGLSSFPKIPPMLMGTIVCPDAIIYCYNVWVSEHTPLKPQEGETEKVAWFNWCDLLYDSRLMPNLRVVIPLMQAGVSGWTLNITTNSLKQGFHNIAVNLPSSGHFSHTETNGVSEVIAGKDIIKRVKREKPLYRGWFRNLRLRLWLWWREVRDGDRKAY